MIPDEPSPLEIIRNTLTLSPRGSGGECRVAAQLVVDHLDRAGFVITRKGRKKAITPTKIKRAPVVVETGVSPTGAQAAGRTVRHHLAIQHKP
jgi:hypothetical protein